MAILGSDVAVIDAVGLQMEVHQTILPEPANISTGLGESSTPLVILPCLAPTIGLNIDTGSIDATGGVGQQMGQGTPYVVLPLSEMKSASSLSSSLSMVTSVSSRLTSIASLIL